MVLSTSTASAPTSIVKATLDVDGYEAAVGNSYASFIDK
jgi:hypothetical protein